METEAEEKLLFILKKYNTQKKHRIKQLFDGIRMGKKIAFPSVFFLNKKKERKQKKKCGKRKTNLFSLSLLVLLVWHVEFP